MNQKQDLKQSIHPQMAMNRSGLGSEIESLLPSKFSPGQYRGFLYRKLPFTSIQISILRKRPPRPRLFSPPLILTSLIVCSICSLKSASVPCMDSKLAILATAPMMESLVALASSSMACLRDLIASPLSWCRLNPCSAGTAPLTLTKLPAARSKTTWNVEISVVAIRNQRLRRRPAFPGWSSSGMSTAMWTM